MTVSTHLQNVSKITPTWIPLEVAIVPSQAGRFVTNEARCPCSIAQVGRDTHDLTQGSMLESATGVTHGDDQVDLTPRFTSEP